MPVTYGHEMADNNRLEPFAEFDEFSYQGNSYVFRVTALYPYKNKQGADPDALFCHIDFINVTQSFSGRFANVQIPGRNLNENEGHLRRHSAMRKLQQLIRDEVPTPSPVYP